MKKSSLLLNVVLLIAVAVLYVLYFTGNKESSLAAVTVSSDDTVSAGGGAIVYVNIDTLMAHYDMSVDLQNQLQKKQQDSESKLNARGQKWQNKVNEFQNNMQRGLVTRSEAQKIQTQLEQEQQEILKMRDDLAGSLMEEQQVSTRKIIYSIVDFLNAYSKQHHYRYVLSSTTVGGAILYGDEQLDITQQVLEGLNEQYKTKRDSLLKAQ